ncbi:MAG: hypothetical protein WB791_05175 [Waddliaceae bacterium]
MSPVNNDTTQSPVEKKNVLPSRVPDQLEAVRTSDRIARMMFDKDSLIQQSDRLPEFAFSDESLMPLLDQQLQLQNQAIERFGEDGINFFKRELSIFSPETSFLWAMMEYMHLKTNALLSFLSQDHSGSIDVWNKHKKSYIHNVSQLDIILRDHLLPALTDPMFILKLNDDEESGGEEGLNFASFLEDQMQRCYDAYEKGIEGINKTTRTQSKKFKRRKKKEGVKQTQFPLAVKTIELFNQLNSSLKVFLTFLKEVRNKENHILDGLRTLEEFMPTLRQQKLKKDEWKEIIESSFKFRQMMIQVRFKQLMKKGKKEEAKELMTSWMSLLPRIKRSVDTLAGSNDKRDRESFFFSHTYPVMAFVIGQEYNMDVNKIEGYYEKMDREGLLPSPNFSPEKLENLMSTQRDLCAIEKHLTNFTKLLMPISHVTLYSFPFIEIKFPFLLLSSLSSSLDVLNGSDWRIDQLLSEIHDNLPSHDLFDALNMQDVLGLFAKQPQSPELTQFLSLLHEVLNEKSKTAWFYSLPFYMEIFDWVREQKDDYERAVNRLRDHLVEQLAERQVPLSEDEIEDLQMIIELMTNVLGYRSLNLQLIQPYLFEMVKGGNNLEQENIYWEAVKKKINVHEILSAAEAKRKDKERQEAEAIKEKTDAQEELAAANANRAEEQSEQERRIQASEIQGVSRTYPPGKKKEKTLEQITASTKLRQILKRFHEFGFKQKRQKKHLILENGPHRAVIPTHGGGSHLSAGVVKNLNKALDESKETE